MNSTTTESLKRIPSRDTWPTAPDSLPQVGDISIWEPLRPHAACEVRVTAVVWNGEEWMIRAEPTTPRPLEPGGGYWNDFSRWLEAVVSPTESDPEE